MQEISARYLGNTLPQPCMPSLYTHQSDDGRNVLICVRALIAAILCELCFCGATSSRRSTRKEQCHTVPGTSSQVDFLPAEIRTAPESPPGDMSDVQTGSGTVGTKPRKKASAACTSCRTRRTKVGYAIHTSTVIRTMNNDVTSVPARRDKRDASTALVTIWSASSMMTMSGR